jgi:hypothetical protein
MGKKYVIDETTMKNIAYEIRNRGGDFVGTDEMTPEEMAETKIGLVYHKGSYDGYNQGFSFGKEHGKQAEYDKFWDAAQDYGRRTGYPYAFGSYIWNDVTFRPKYDIRPEGNAIQLLRYSQITDLVSILEEQGVVLDLSKATVIEYGFNNCTTRRLGVIDCTSATSARSLFNAAVNLEEIELFRVTEKLEYNGTFNNTAKLEKLTVDGVIGQNGLNLSACTKLNKASHLSIFGCISTTAAITVTFSKVAVDKAFETAPGANDGSTSQEWNDLVDTRPNATIVLA